MVGWWVEPPKGVEYEYPFLSRWKVEIGYISLYLCQNCSPLDRGEKYRVFLFLWGIVLVKGQILGTLVTSAFKFWMGSSSNPLPLFFLTFIS